MTIDCREIGAAYSTLNVGAGSTLIKSCSAAGEGVGNAPPQMITCVRVSVITSPTTASTVNDCATTGAIATSNAFLTIPASTAAGTVYMMYWPCFQGLAVSVGTAGVLAISWT